MVIGVCSESRNDSLSHLGYRCTSSENVSKERKGVRSELGLAPVKRKVLWKNQMKSTSFQRNTTDVLFTESRVSFTLMKITNDFLSFICLSEKYCKCNGYPHVDSECMLGKIFLWPWAGRYFTVTSTFRTPRWRTECQLNELMHVLSSHVICRFDPYSQHRWCKDTDMPHLSTGELADGFNMQEKSLWEKLSNHKPDTSTSSRFIQSITLPIDTVHRLS
jgi:hypothetical protein